MLAFYTGAKKLFLTQELKAAKKLFISTARNNDMAKLPMAIADSQGSAPIMLY